MIYLSLLFHILQLNLKSYMDLLLIWGPIYPQKIILPMKKGREMVPLCQNFIGSPGWDGPVPLSIVQRVTKTKRGERWWRHWPCSRGLVLRKERLLQWPHFTVTVSNSRSHRIPTCKWQNLQNTSIPLEKLKSDSIMIHR